MTFLNEAKLTGAHLEGANLSKVAGLTNDQIGTAIVDSETRLPNYLRADEEEGSEAPEADYDEVP